jgi:P pilus assembly protein, pilin FimA
MKWTHSGGLLAALLLMAPPVLYAADPTTDTVTITVNGRVVAKPCTISTTNANVDLGNLYTYDLASAGAASAWKSVSLDLTNCPVGTSKVTATFTGTADTTGYYSNQGTAGNVQLELQDTDGIQLNNNATKTVQVNDATLQTTFPLQVRALTVNGGATQGSIQAVINVTYTWS